MPASLAPGTSTGHRQRLSLLDTLAQLINENPLPGARAVNGGQPVDAFWLRAQAEATLPADSPVRGRLARREMLAPEDVAAVVNGLGYRIQAFQPRRDDPAADWTVITYGEDDQAPVLRISYGVARHSR